VIVFFLKLMGERREAIMQGKQRVEDFACMIMVASIAQGLQSIR